MRSLLIVVTLTALAAAPASAQRPKRSWSPELGVQGGFTRFKFAGTGHSDQADFFDAPGFVGLAPVVPAGVGALFAIIPVHDALALEPAVTTAQLTAAGGATVASLGLRADYAVTRAIYLAAGGVLGFVETSGQHETQLGVQAALGYRVRLAGRLAGRVEVDWQSANKAKLLPPWNTYSVLFGISSRVAGAATPSGAAGGARAPRRTGVWQPVLGVAGGYSRIHFIGGGGDITVMSFPIWGTGLAASPFGTVAPTAPTLFAVIPVAARLALEPGVDFHRTQSQGTTIFSGNFAARLDWAVSGGWYAAGGLNFHFIKATKGAFPDSTTTSVTLPGATVAWGYRFPLSGDLGGRVELNYTLFRQNADLSQATNTVGLLVGATLPLK